MKIFEENDDEQLTIDNLIKQMGESLKDGLEPYSFPYMKKEVKKYFGNRIIIAEKMESKMLLPFTQVPHRYYKLFMRRRRKSRLMKRG